MEYESDYIPYNRAYNAEPFRKPDHKAKKHGRPAPGTYKRTYKRYQWTADPELRGSL